MSRLYPSLHEKFKSEGICPICLTEMAYSPRFSCNSDHVICQRCRPYYFNCPQCLQPLREIAAATPATQSRPYPSPSAPDLDEFHEHERRPHWSPQPMPTEEPRLLECPYSHLGCSAKFVPALRDVHVPRCQYKHHNEAELAQIVASDQPDDRPCRYEAHGCNVRLAHWRLSSHEEACIYKDREPSPASDWQRDDERVACRYRSVGCNVRLSGWRLAGHEDICIYKDREPSPTPRDCSLPLPQADDEPVACRYQSTGCNVRLPHCQVSSHEDVCIYKNREPSPLSDEDDRVPCRFRSVGCNVRAPRWRLRSHEDMCIYKDRLGGDSRSVEELGQQLRGSCHLHEDPYRVVDCRYQAWGCNARVPLWRQQDHEYQCTYRRH